LERFESSGGPEEAILTANGREWTQMGKQPKTEILAGEQETQEKGQTGGEMGFSSCFPVVSCYPAMLGVLGALEGLKRRFSAGKQEICMKTGGERGAEEKPISNVEC
jgi:hypothetical protein